MRTTKCQLNIAGRLIAADIPTPIQPQNPKWVKECGAAVAEAIAEFYDNIATDSSKD